MQGGRQSMAAWGRTPAAFFDQRPCLRDALLWSVPAIIIGALLRVWLLWIQPHAYWGADSGSYFWFAQRLLLEGQISLPAKRQFLYPIFLVPVSLLPGPVLTTLAGVQHALGLATCVAAGYCVRKLFVQWKWWIVPVTAIFAVFPMMLWYEHELIGEALFVQTFAWAFAGWLVWRGRDFLPSGFWWFFVPFAACVLTKSAGRFFWAGILIGLIFYGRKLRWPQFAVLAVLFVVSWTMGERSQGVRLLYTSVFPLTVMDSPLHAELKAEIRPLVEEARANLQAYHLYDDAPKEFLRTGFKNPEKYASWAALKDNEAALWKAVREIALEAAMAHPVEFFLISVRRSLSSLDLQNFRTERFAESYFPDRFESHLEKMFSKGELGRAQVNLLFGKAPEPGMTSGEFFEELFGERTGEPGARTLAGIAADFHRAFTPISSTAAGGFSLTPTGFLLLAALILSLTPKHFSGLGVWWLVAGGYALGVHLLGSANPRFLLPIWPVLIIALAAPLDSLVCLLKKLGQKRSAHS